MMVLAEDSASSHTGVCSALRRRLFTPGAALVPVSYTSACCRRSKEESIVNYNCMIVGAMVEVVLLVPLRLSFDMSYRLGMVSKVHSHSVLGTNTYCTVKLKI
jgi:hypothetical protein